MKLLLLLVPFVLQAQLPTSSVGAGSASSGATGNSVTSTTAATANANSTSDQALMELSLTAGYLNSAGQPFKFEGAFLYSTQTLQTPTINLKVKLCTVSGCGSGTVVTLVSITSGASLASVTNQNVSFSFTGTTSTIGASGNLEVHGPLVIDLGATTVTADTVYGDTNTGVSGNINLTAALFVDFTVAFSTQPGTPFNSMTQRFGGVMPFAATAAAVSAPTPTPATVPWRPFGSPLVGIAGPSAQNAANRVNCQMTTAPYPGEVVKHIQAGIAVGAGHMAILILDASGTLLANGISAVVNAPGNAGASFAFSPNPTLTAGTVYTLCFTSDNAGDSIYSSGTYASFQDNKDLSSPNLQIFYCANPSAFSGGVTTLPAGVCGAQTAQADAYGLPAFYVTTN